MKTSSTSPPPGPESLRDMLSRLWRRAISPVTKPGDTIRREPERAETEPPVGETTIALPVRPGPSADQPAIAGKASASEAGPPPSEKAPSVAALLEPEAGEMVRTASTYELGEAVGRGGTAVVFGARQRELARSVAVKMVRPDKAADPGVLKRFLAEARIIASLDHPNIIPLHALGTDRHGRVFLVMKFVGGTPWAELLPAHPPSASPSRPSRRFTLRDHLEVLLHICDAVTFAHSRGIIHRDLKPENVMVGEYGEVFVTDWGLAIELGEVGAGLEGGRYESLGGTPSYMAPELARGEIAQVGPQTDVYLLGAMLYELLTGRPPHRGQTVVDTILRAAENKVESPKSPPGTSEFDEELARTAMKALETDPAKRYQNVAAFQAAIRAYLMHAESYTLSRRAWRQLAPLVHELQGNQDLTRRKSDEMYLRLAHCVAAFEQASALWAENPHARRGRIRAISLYANLAIRQGDLNLARSQIQELTALPGCPPRLVAKLAAKLQMAEESEQERSRMVQDALRISNELTAAKAIQDNLLPQRMPVIPGYDIHAAYRAAKQVGGDYYDFIPVDKERLGLVVADVSAHGIPGAMTMVATRTLLRMQAPGNTSAAEVLKNVNRLAARDLQPGMFVTALYAILEVKRRLLTIASAGHNPLLLYRAAAGQVEFLKPGGIALGFDPGPVFNQEIQEQTITLLPGDRVVLYTNGLVDARNEQQESWGLERFVRFITAGSEMPSADFVANLTSHIEQHRKGAEQHDDLTVVSMRVLPALPRPNRHDSA